VPIERALRARGAGGRGRRTTLRWFADLAFRRPPR